MMKHILAHYTFIEDLDQDSFHYINIFYTFKYLKQVNFDYKYWKDLKEFRQNLSMTKEHYKTT